MKEVTLTASARSSVGKGAARQSRFAGNIPGVVYGPEIDPFTVEINEKVFRSAIKEAHGTTALFNLEVNGKTNKVIIREIQRDPVTSSVMHIDFHIISMKKPIHISIPIKIKGTAKGVKTDGGILQTTLHEVEISCLPTDIPEFVEIDVSELSIGDSIHVKNLNIPKATILSEESRTVVVIAAPTIIKVDEPVAEAEELAEGEEAAAEGAEGAPAEGDAKEGAKAEGKTEEKKDEKKKGDKKK